VVGHLGRAALHLHLRGLQLLLDAREVSEVDEPEPPDSGAAEQRGAERGGQHAGRQTIAPTQVSGQKVDADHVCLLLVGGGEPDGDGELR